MQNPLLSLPGSCKLCPVTAYYEMIKVVHGKPSDPLFILPNWKPVTYYLFKKIRLVLHDLGHESSLFSTHSFRRGFATLAFQINVSSDEIQILGDWRSDVSLSFEDKFKIIKNISYSFYI